MTTLLQENRCLRLLLPTGAERLRSRMFHPSRVVHVLHFVVAHLISALIPRSTSLNRTWLFLTDYSISLIRFHATEIRTKRLV